MIWGMPYQWARRNPHLSAFIIGVASAAFWTRLAWTNCGTLAAVTGCHALYWTFSIVFGLGAHNAATTPGLGINPYPSQEDQHDDPQPSHGDERDRGTSNVIGLLMAMGIVVSLMGPVYMLAGSIMDTTQAQREAAEKAAWCSRNPDQEWPGEGECPTLGPRAWTCTEGSTINRTLKCTPIDTPKEPDDYTILHTGNENLGTANDSN